MKDIVILTRTLPFHSVGGMQAVAWDLARQFAASGFRTTIITTRISGKPEKFQEDGVEVVALAQAPPERYTRAWWRFSRDYFMANFAGRAAGVISISAGAYGLRDCKLHLPPGGFILQAHGTSLGEFISKWKSRRLRSWVTSVRNLLWMFIDRRAYADFDCIVGVGPKVKEDFERAFYRRSVKENRLAVIENGIDTGLFKPSINHRHEVRERLGIPENAKVIVSACRLHVQKGVDLSLRGFARLSQTNPETYFIIIGDGPEMPALKKLAAELKITSKVRFAGSLSREAVAAYLAAGNVFLFTTLRVEGFPLNVLEALAVGLPCVVSDHLDSVLEVSPFVTPVNPRSPEAIAECLRAALNHSSVESLLPAKYSLQECANAYIRLMGLASDV
ncbi:MAG: glycosyltransferase family 4 protein [Gammaproteobacteria bacterium]|nr:glycosyltransferase family 4 protein [Gammaproteobacteria bacterium]